MSLFYEFIKELLLSYKIYPKIAMYGAALGTFIFLILLSLIFFYISRTILLRIVGKVIRRTKGMWGIVLYQHRVFQVLTHILPAVLIYSSSGFGSPDLEWLPFFILGFARLYIVIVFISASLRFLDATLDIYNTYSYAKERNIKGYVQLVKIMIYFGGGIFILAILMGQNPATILAGFGALTAVLAFVFKDPILGFVASIQLAANKMVKQGDWITLPKHDIDGTVEEITLTTVKIQNWDKTITTLPTYSLVSEPMKNWIGMMESGGRRIQRAISIDMNSIKFCDRMFIEKLRKDPDLFGFFRSLTSDDLKGNSNFAGPLLTNLTLFKYYLEKYIETHPAVHQEMGKMVRLLPAGEKGLPVEIIFFTKLQEANAYEKVQFSIIDHFIAILFKFELSIFQNPTDHVLQYTGTSKLIPDNIDNN